MDVLAQRVQGLRVGNKLAHFRRHCGAPFEQAVVSLEQFQCRHFNVGRRQQGLPCLIADRDGHAVFVDALRQAHLAQHVLAHADVQLHLSLQHSAQLPVYVVRVQRAVELAQAGKLSVSDIRALCGQRLKKLLALLLNLIESSLQISVRARGQIVIQRGPRGVVLLLLRNQHLLCVAVGGQAGDRLEGSLGGSRVHRALNKVGRITGSLKHWVVAENLVQSSQCFFALWAIGSATQSVLQALACAPCHDLWRKVDQWQLVEGSQVADRFFL